MHLVALFCHSNDVFIGAHIENIEKFKKSLFSLWFTIYVFILILIICSFFYIYLISVLKLVLFINETYN